MSTIFKDIRSEVLAMFATAGAVQRGIAVCFATPKEMSRIVEAQARKSTVKIVGEDVLAGCDLSFRKGLEKLRLAAHNTRAYWYKRRPGSLHFGLYPLRLDRQVSNFGVELTYQRGEGVVVAVGGGVPTPDAKLIEQAARNAVNHHPETRPLWSVLADTFGIGSTRAHQLARRFGLDPDRPREGRVVTIGEGSYCNSCDSYHCAKCDEVTTHSTDCEQCGKRCPICNDPSENPCSGHPAEDA